MKQAKTRKPNKTQPSIIEIFNRFSTEEACIAHFEKIRWPEGPVCPRCGGQRISQFTAEGKTGKDRHIYESRHRDKSGLRGDDQTPRETITGCHRPGDRYR